MVCSVALVDVEAGVLEEFGGEFAGVAEEGCYSVVF